MLPDTAASLVETSDSDIGFTISIGFGGGVYVEVDTDGVGCGALVVWMTGGGEGLVRGAVLDGAGAGFLVVAITVAAGVEDGEAAERVAARVTVGLAECRGLAVGPGAVPLTGAGTPSTPVGLLSTESATGLGRGPPDRAATSPATTAPAPTTAAAATTTLDTRRGLATVTGLGNPS
jgi:hypothetical protein